MSVLLKLCELLERNRNELIERWSDLARKML